MVTSKVGFLCRQNSVYFGCCNLSSITKLILYTTLMLNVLSFLESYRTYEWTIESRKALAPILKKFIVKDSNYTEVEFQNLMQNTMMKLDKIRLWLVGHAVINIIICTFALHGFYRQKNKFFVPYLVYNAFEVIGWLVVMVYLIIRTASDPSTFYVFLLGSIASFGFDYYMFLILYSYYKELTGDDKQNSNTTIDSGV